MKVTETAARAVTEGNIQFTNGAPVPMVSFVYPFDRNIYPSVCR